jgi:hypothetical protein
VGRLHHDLKRCRLIARIVALAYNWWNIYVRLVNPERHMEAITSRLCCCMPLRARSATPDESR